MNIVTKVSTLKVKDGGTLSIRDWPLEYGVPSRGMVVVVHGLGEHSGRHITLASKLNEWGFSVRSYDHVGHGHSSGLRGSLPTDTKMLDDLAEILDNTREMIGKDTPLILLGHSMGGLVVGRFVSLNMRPIDALIMSSPALDPGLTAFQKLLVKVLPGLVPDLRVGNGLNRNYISHDRKVVTAYKADPLVHDRVSARLGKFFATAGPDTEAAASQWEVPTLLMYSGDDRILNWQGSKRFAANAPKEVVKTVCFADMYHELFNEKDSRVVYRTLGKWLDGKFPAKEVQEVQEA